MTRESFRWRILGEGARGSSSRSASAVSKSSLLFVRAEKSARSLELPAATRIGIYVKLEACQARTGGIQFKRSFPGTFQAAVLLQMQNTPGWHTPRPMAHHPQRFAIHDPSPQTMGLAGVFEFAKKQLAGGGKQIHSEHRRTAAESPVPAMRSQSGMCE